MEVIKTKLDGVFIVQPRVFKDSRGYFYESFNEQEFKEKVCDTTFVQDNQSKSTYGVLRGLHFQSPPHAQAKLVRCVKGSVLDVAVDIRKGSPTYGQYVSVLLTEDNYRQLFIPKGFAHGFSTLTDEAVFQYKVDDIWCKECEGGINILSLGIDWGVRNEDVNVSRKDSHYVNFDEFESPFVYNDWKC